MIRPLLGLLALATSAAAETPNIVVILADDLGYGDVRCYNPTRGRIPTPHIDMLAAQGMRFTDAHSSSSACSPTRYSLLTGRYHWRTRLQQGIVPVWGEPLIAADRMTIGTLAKHQGYHSACIGKWHLGNHWPITADEKKHFQNLGGQRGGGGKVVTEITDAQREAYRNVFAQKIEQGPTTRGFNEYFGTDVPNWPPYCFIEGDRTIGVPNEFLPAKLLEKNLASLQGPALPGWTLEPILPALTNRACEVIAKQAQAKKPFLLYLPLTSPHTPLSPTKEWRGRSGLGPYGDLVMQTDAVVGQVLDSLDKNGIADNTLVVFTSDNGCASYIGVKELEAAGHYPSGPWRGYKADAWEGGHRLPFIVRWPGRVKPGTTCDQTICSVDLLATLADILNTKLPANAGEDSVSLLPLLRGDNKPVHDAVIHHSSTGGIFCVREQNWKLILGPGSGRPDGKAPHLYDLAADPGETNDVAAANADVVKRLRSKLDVFITNGRSTPGEIQKNDVAITVIKPAAKK